MGIARQWQTSRKINRKLGNGIPGQQIYRGSVAPGRLIQWHTRAIDIERAMQ